MGVIQKQIRIEKKGKTSMPLGWYLANLEREKFSQPDQFDEDEYSKLEHIRKRVEELKNLNTTIEILNRIPENPCLLGRPFLKDNLDYFISLFLISTTENDCLRLAKHINSCLGCFEIFSQTIRDYHQNTNL